MRHNLIAHDARMKNKNLILATVNATGRRKVRGGEQTRNSWPLQHQARCRPVASLVKQSKNGRLLLLMASYLGLGLQISAASGGFGA